MNHYIGISISKVTVRLLTCEVCDFSLRSTRCVSPHLLTSQSGIFLSANGETPFCGRPLSSLRQRRALRRGTMADDIDHDSPTSSLAFL